MSQNRPKVDKPLIFINNFYGAATWNLYHCPVSGLQWLTSACHSTARGKCLLIPTLVRSFTLMSGKEEKGPWMPWFKKILRFLEKNEVHFTDDCILQPLPEEVLASLKL